MHLRVLSSPEPLRQGLLFPTNLARLVGNMSVAHALTAVPGVGKTYAMLALILSGAWRQYFDAVFVFMYTRRLMDDFAQKLRDGLELRKGSPDGQDVFLPGLEPTIYPTLDDAPCGPTPEVRGFVERGLGTFVQVNICAHCPHQNACSWATGRKASIFQEAEVVIAPSALLKVLPHIVGEWTDGRRILVVDDEASGASDGFIQTFTTREVEAEARCASLAGCYTVVDFYRKLLRHPDPNQGIPSNVPEIAKIALELQSSGATMPGYRFIAPLVYDYACGLGLWNEGSTFAVARYPTLPSSTLFMGGCLDHRFLEWRYNVPTIRDPLPDVRVMHPETTVVHIKSSLGSLCNLHRNQEAIINLAADIIVKNIREGKTTVLLGCQDRIGRTGRLDEPLATQALSALRAALDRRGLQCVQLLAPGDPLPAKPTPSQIPFVHFGAAGSNDYEDYTSAVFLNSFNVSAETLREKVFDRLPPTKRPTFKIMDGREIVWESPVEEIWKERAAMMLRRMEVDVLLQAAHRVRFAINPRTVVICSMHDLRFYLGRATVVTTITEARAALGLASAKGEVRERAMVIIRGALALGLTQAAAAKRAGVSERTVRLWAAEEGLKSRSRGRPKKQLMGSPTDGHQSEATSAASGNPSPRMPAPKTHQGSPPPTAA